MNNEPRRTMCPLSQLHGAYVERVPYFFLLLEDGILADDIY